MLSIPCFLLPSSFGLRFSISFSSSLLVIYAFVHLLVFFFFELLLLYVPRSLSRPISSHDCFYMSISISINSRFRAKYHDITFGWCWVQRITSSGSQRQSHVYGSFELCESLSQFFKNNTRAPNRWPKGRCTTNIPLTSVSIGLHNTDPCRDRTVPYFPTACHYNTISPQHLTCSTRNRYENTGYKTDHGWKVWTSSISFVGYRGLWMSNRTEDRGVLKSISVFEV